MILVTMGTHAQPFMRLAHEVARLVDEGIIKEKVIMQAGNTPFSHARIEVHRIMDPQTYADTVKKARLVITHSGAGGIGHAMEYKKPLILVPRRKKYGEHTNDHQMELGKILQEQGRGILVTEMSELAAAIEKAGKMKAIPAEPAYYLPILNRIAREQGLLVKKEKQSFTPPKSATIVVATLNGGEPLIHAIRGMLDQRYKGKWDVVVVDDGSWDKTTPHLLRRHFENNPRVTIITLPRSGVCKARNAGIRAATNEVVINMDHDCIPEKDWLERMMSGFDSPRVGAVSAYGGFGGTSTAFRRDLLHHLGGYDEDYFYYREDTDLSFRIMELGYEYRKVDGARYREDRTLVRPRGIHGIVRYTLQRMRYHMNDVLLHKKHPYPLCEKFLHVKWKCIVDPVEDFKVVTGLWNGNEEMALSSPRGMTFYSGRGIARFGAMVMIGLAYAFAIKWARLAGSLKHGHLLV